jgi:acyl carrier protein
MKTVADRVRKLIADQFEVESVKDDAQIGWDLGADSLDAVELLMAVEDEFDVQIEDAEVERESMTVAEAIALVESKMEPRR